MKDRKAITRELSEKYKNKKATKKQKGIILDEFTALTGYNRAYASYLLITHGKTIKVAKNRVIKADVKMKKRGKRRSMSLSAGLTQSLAHFLRIK